MLPTFDALLLRLFRRTKQRLQAIAERHSLTFPQLISLFRLYCDGRMTMSDLTMRLGVTRGALTGMVDRLEEAGLVSRQPDEQDRRVVHLALTPRGLVLMQAFSEDWHDAVEDWLAPLDEKSRASLRKSLSMLLESETSHGPE